MIDEKTYMDICRKGLYAGGHFMCTSPLATDQLFTERLESKRQNSAAAAGTVWT